MSQTKAELIEPQGNVAFDTNTLYVDAGNNRVGIGTTSPSTAIDCVGTLRLRNNSSSAVQFYTEAGGAEGQIFYDQANNNLEITNFNSGFISFKTNDAERGRWDSSGRLLVGTSSASFSTTVKLQGNSGSSTGESRIRLCRGTATPANGDTLAILGFSDNTETPSAEIAAQRDGGTWSASSVPGRLVFSTTADGASSPTERMRITSAGGVRLPDVYNATIALSANVFIDTDGTLKRATSSIKYKANVETLEDQYADAVLNCRPVWYQSTSAGDNPNWGFWGFIAEEVAEIDPRLVQWKTVDQVINEDGSRETIPLDTPEPENVAYDRFVPHLLNLIKRQKEQIEAMEARLTALEQS